MVLVLLLAVLPTPRGKLKLQLAGMAVSPATVPPAAA